MKPRIIKKNVNLRIYDTLMALYGNTKTVNREYKKVMFRTELRTLNLR
jgi:hypothetical protein